MIEARIQHFFDEATSTLSYVASDPDTGDAAVIDPVLGYCAASGHTDPATAERIVDYLQANTLSLRWILETHAHADHLSGAQYLKARAGGDIAIGVGICKVQAHFGPLFNLKPPFAADGHQFDHLFDAGERFAIGAMDCEVLTTPGHTNDSVSYRIGNDVFVGDTLFMPDYGTARCDFPGGDPAVLYDSIQKLLSLPDATRLNMCHDYRPGGRELRWVSTVAEQREENVHLGNAAGKDEFVAMRRERDASLDLPALIVPSIQVNIRAGQLPAAEDNGIAYIKIPIDTLG